MVVGVVLATCAAVFYLVLVASASFDIFPQSTPDTNVAVAVGDWDTEDVDPEAAEWMRLWESSSLPFREAQCEQWMADEAGYLQTGVAARDFAPAVTTRMMNSVCPSVLTSVEESGASEPNSVETLDPAIIEQCAYFLNNPRAYVDAAVEQGFDRIEIGTAMDEACRGVG